MSLRAFSRITRKLLTHNKPQSQAPQHRWKTRRLLQLGERLESRTLLAGDVPLNFGVPYHETLGTVGDVDTYLFSLDTPTRVYVDGLAAFQTIAWQIDNQGITVDQGTLSSDHISNLIPGTYKLKISAGNDLEGGYSFQVHQLGDATSLLPGVLVNGSLSPASETDAYRFNAVAWDHFSFSSAVATPQNARWRLMDPYGAEVYSTALGDSQPDVTLPHSGQYTLLLEGNSGDSGSTNYSIGASFLANLPPTSFTGTSLSLGTIETSAIDSPGTQKNYVISIAADSQLYFDSLTNDDNILWTLISHSGAIINDASFASSDSYNEPLAQLKLPTGQYQLSVLGVGNWTGSFSFRMMNLSAAVPIGVDSIVTGGLTPAIETDSYRFNAIAGNRFAFSSQQQGSMQNAFWRMLGPNGYQAFGYFSTTRFVDTFTVPLTGQYTVLVEGYIDDSGDGSYSFKVISVPSNPPIAMTLNTTIVGNIDNVGETDSYTFDLTGDRQLYFDSLTNDDTVDWTLIGEIGTVVSSSSFASSDWFYGPTNQLRLPSGHYTLVVDRGGDAVGEYMFRMLDLAGAAPLTVGSVVTGNLSPANETDAYQLSAAAGDTFYFDLLERANMPNAGLRLVRPNGTQIFTSSLGPGNGGKFTAPVAGQYTVLIEGYVGDSGNGSYSFRINRVPINPSTQLELNTTIIGSLDVPGESDTYIFDLTDSRQLYFDSLTNDASVKWSLTGPLGEVVINTGFDSSDWFYATQYSPLHLPLPAGRYTLTVDRAQATVGGYSFRMLDLSTATPLALGSLVSGDLTPATETDVYQFSAVAGTQFYFDVQQLDGMPSASWCLKGPTGIPIFNNFIGDVDTLTVPLTGQYTLLVEGYVGDTGNGNYRFRVYNVPNNPAIALALDTTVSGSLDVPGESDSYTFDLSGARQLYFDSLTESDDNVRWTLTGPLGTAVSGAGFASSDWLNEPLNQLRLSSGSYTLTVDRNRDTVGGYTFRMLDLSQAAPLTVGSLTTDSLLPANETDTYRFNAAAWDHFFFTSAVAAPQNARWSLLNPYGGVVFTTGLANSQADVTLPYTGEYTLLIEGYIDDTDSINYSIGAVFLANTPPASFVSPASTPLLLDTVVSSAITIAGTQKIYVFDLASDDQLYFDSLTNNNNVKWTLISHTGTIVESASFASSDWFSSQLVQLRLPAGQYQLNIAGVGNWTGSFSFEMLSLSAAVPLALGNVITGNLTPALETDTYQFSGVAGTSLYFDLLLKDNLPNASWRLIGPTGNQLFENFMQDQDTLTLALTGQYTLLVEGYIGDSGNGNYSFRVSNVPSNPTMALALNTTIAGSLDVVGELDTYTFDLTSDSQLYFDSLTNDNSVTWRLVGPLGIAVSATGFANADWFNEPLNQLRLPSGRYTLTVDRLGDGVGGYSFRMLDLSMAAPLTVGDLVAGSLTPASETDAYQFSAVAGASFYFDLQQQENMPNASWHLFGPAGTHIFNNYIGDVNTLTLPLTGQYTLLLEGYVGDIGIGNYSFRVISVPNNASMAMALNTTINGSLDTVGESDNYTFDLSSDFTQLYFDSLTNDGNFQWELRPITDNGAEFNSYAASFTNSDWLNEPLNKLHLPAGQYAFTVKRTGETVGSYSFRMLDLSTVAPLTVGSVVTGGLTPASETDAFQFTAVAGENLFFDLQQNDNMPNASWRLIGPTGAEVFNSYLGDVNTLKIPVAGRYTLLVEGYVADSGAGTYRFKVSSVDLNPANSDLSQNQIAENLPAGVVVGNFSTSDIDSSSSPVYALTSGAGDTGNPQFQIVGNELRTASVFNFEQNSSFTIRVRTTDSLGLDFDHVFTIAVLDANESPTNVALSNSLINENEAANAVVGTLTGTDPDSSDVLTFSLPAGVGDNAAFNILGNQLRATASLDFETKTSYVITVRATDVGGLTLDKSFTISVLDINEHLQALAPVITKSTISLRFNKTLDATKLNLVDSNNVNGASDLTLVGSTVGAVKGSMVLDADGMGFTFVKSGGPLIADIYTLTLRSASNGFVDAAGDLLDGDVNGVAGGDFVRVFTSTAIPANNVVLSVPDFERGAGQAVNLPANTANGLPITISTGLNVRVASFNLNYNPALLTITGGSTPIAGATVTVDSTTAGVARVTVISATQFSAAAGVLTLVNLTATVPTTAPLGPKSVLRFSDVSVTATDASALTSVSDDGLQISAYKGDVNNSNSITTGDVTGLLRSISGALSTTGFPTFKLADPAIVGDMNDSSSLTTGDATGLLRFISGAAGGFQAIPALPTGLTPTFGADPEIFIPQNLRVTPGSTIVVPIKIRVTEPTGVSIAGVQVSFSYDASRFTVGTISTGSALAGFTFSSSSNTTTAGLARMVYALDVGPTFAYGFVGTLLNVTLIAKADALPGASAINLTSAGASDNDTNDLTIAPVITAGVDSSDGMVTIPGPDNALPTTWANVNLKTAGPGCGNSLGESSLVLSMDSTKVTSGLNNSKATNVLGIGINQFTYQSTDDFFRMYGNSNGDGVPSKADTEVSRAALTGNDAAFDVDGDDLVVKSGVARSNFLGKRRR